ncbi:hypothetical protein AJ79_00583 [Helicocarpus griseus UAMH5409]|uniref:Cutinase n=1 Tax=Helicocarpus griseus UAMH5409 TaxID=1447875 RepID=A0A2B7Y2D9_9EURO|nr:hypothetical protein AJ79_00583 [Helicocarpus griseus UAMH5409]
MLKISALIFVLCLIYSGAATPVSERASNHQANDCHSIHIFAARGSTEPYPGQQGVLINAICQKQSSCGYEDIGYPATFEDYCTSAAKGVSNGTSLITAYAKRCPDAKLVLTGYSQGAHVIGDILGGGGGNCPVGGLQPTNEALSPESMSGKQFVAAVLFGDVRHTAGQSYNIGTGADKNGIWPREGEQLVSLNRWESRLRSWCDEGDPVCAGGPDQSRHFAYFDTVINQAAEWIRTKV